MIRAQRPDGFNTRPPLEANRPLGRAIGSHASFIKYRSDSESALPGIHTTLEGYTMTSKSTRRAILAGAATLPALAIPAFATIEIDPIFPAIERHKVTFHASQAADNIRMGTVDAEWSPCYDAVKCKAVKKAASVADDAATDAANALTTIRPTTITGLLALMRHVEAFNAGAFVLDIDPDNWRSHPMNWPTDIDDDEIDLFGYSILANVRAALEAMAVQS